ncbi:MAG: sulfite exporter TauE/SafE family protein [Thaumarchaeota archaeon]|nr:sulfite exporter TauE/SafE family protein [Nitrososphaerota archaeon]MDE1818584.1 sulfite exporter TauE/SafE family protein [Nitrososphaerota archaeon]
MTDSFSLVLLAVLGLAIGFVGGLVGLVLGVVRFPLVLGSEISASVAAGTNIGVSILGAFTAAIRHFRQNNIHRRTFLVMASTGAVGGFLGSLITKHVPVNLLLLAIGIIVSYEAYVIFSGLQKKINPSQENKKRNSVPIESLIGFTIGFLGGLVGLVLGSIRMPVMISVLKMDPKVAVGTNLASATVMGHLHC